MRTNVLGKKIIKKRCILATISLSLIISSLSYAADFTARSLGDYGNVTVMEVTGNYDADNADGTVNVIPRQIIAKEFFKTHKDEYDFLVIFSNFDFAMPQKEKGALGFYTAVKNDVQGLGLDMIDNTSLYGSEGKLQGTIDMGNLAKKVTDPLDPKFEETLGVLSHEIMHRWAAFVKFKDANGNISKALLGHDSSHWSFLLGSGGSLMYGNKWQDNGNGTFTSTTPQGQMKFYSPLDLYLMGMSDKSKVPPMLLIANPDVDSTRLPEAGITITGTAQHVTIDQIIAAIGPRTPDASSSQKSFKSAFIFITEPNTFTGKEIPDIENVRNGAVTRFSILTDGAAIMQVASTIKEDVSTPPIIIPPSGTPRSAPPSIEDGVKWLLDNQQGNGNWTGSFQTTELDTIEATHVLKNFSNVAPSYQKGLGWIQNVTSQNLDFLARKIETLADAGQDVAPLVQEILARQNSDGGWGGMDTYLSNVADTALVLNALSIVPQAGLDQTVLLRAIQYLKSKQNADGGWGSNDKGSMVGDTSAVLSILNRYRAQSGTETAITNGTAWVVAKQNPDGGFGNSPSTVYDTAMAMLALRELNASKDITNSALLYISNHQSADGSWNASAHQTALAIKAMLKASVDPDLAISDGDITFTPDSITALPANLVINAVISNFGRTGASAKVALYDGYPTEGGKIGEQTLAFAGNGITTVTFLAAITDGNPHRYTIVVDPDNLVPESNKLNNMASKIMNPVTSYDLEVLASDITISANTVDMFQDVKVTTTIRNRGTAPAYSVQLKYYLDIPGTPFDILFPVINVVPANGTATSEITWKAAKPGVNMPLTVVVDPYNVFAELSKLNNKASVSLTVNPDSRPNLSLSYKDMVITPSPANERGNANIAARVTNNGFSAVNNVVVNFYNGVAGAGGGVLLGQKSIPSLASGESVTVSVDWTNIPDAGEKIISVQAAAIPAMSEIKDDDNTAFTTLTVLTLPDLAITTNAITFNPAFPKENDPVVITVSVMNNGEQQATNVLVHAYEGSVLIGSQTIAFIDGRAHAETSFPYSTAGHLGVHDVTIVVDPQNTIVEQTKENNRALRAFSVQNADIWLTEPYISPNGDGVKDSTQFAFRLEPPQTVNVTVANQKNEVARTFSGQEFINYTGSTLTWDGLNNDGMLVNDGQYRILVNSAQQGGLGSLPITVDNNRSPLTDAIGTKYLMNNNLTCSLPDLSQWAWNPDESGIVFIINNLNPLPSEYTAGLYTMTPDGDSVIRIIPSEWTQGLGAFDYGIRKFVISPDSEHIAFVLNKYSRATSNAVTSELWVVDREGKNLTLFASYDVQQFYPQVLDLKWSSRGDFIAYEVLSNDTSVQLWIARKDKTGFVNIDSTSQYLWINDIQWSPDDAKIAYPTLSTDAAGNSIIKVMAYDVSGVRTELITPSGYSGKIAWLTTEKLVFVDDLYPTGKLWLLDAVNPGNNQLLTDALSAMPIISPDQRSIVYAATPGATASLTIADASGKTSVFDEFMFENPECIARYSSIVWSPDSNKLVYKKTVRGVGEGMYSTCADPQIVVADRRTNRQILVDSTVFDSTAYDSYPDVTLFGWMSDGLSIAGSHTWDTSASGYPDIIFINAETGRIITTVQEGFAESISPREHYLAYFEYIGSGSVCAGPKSHSNLWAMSSLLNLTADLRVTKDKSALLLKGTAADLNFEGYKLEYADMKTPAVWESVIPPADAPVLNGTFASWVPPADGTYLIKLTVWDKAGNTAIDQKRAYWGQNAPVSNLYKSADLFSPNPYSGKNSVEIHYRVNEPVHLEFIISDSSGKRVKSITADHAVTGEYSINWNGKDENDAVVPDGEYKIQVLDLVLYVEVDSRLPKTFVKFNQISYAEDRETKSPVVTGLYEATATDKNLKEWVIEYGEGENPEQWHEYARGSSDLDKTKFDFNVFKPIVMAGKRVRITADDRAGNRSVALSGLLEKKIILRKYDGELVSENRKGLTPGTHTVELIEVLGGAIVSRTVQFSQHAEQVDPQTKTMVWTQWKDVPSVQVASDPSIGTVTLEWNTPSLEMGKPVAFRAKVMDTAGREFYTTELISGDLFSISQGGLPCTSTRSDAVSLTGRNFSFSNITLIKFQAAFITPDQILLTEMAGKLAWRDIEFYDGIHSERMKAFSFASGGAVPWGEFPILVPRDQLTGDNNAIRMIGVSEKGIYTSVASRVDLNINFVGEGPVLRVAKTVLEPACNELFSGQIKYQLSLEGGGDTLHSLAYSVKTPQNQEIISQTIDLTKSSFEQNNTFNVDTTLLPEGDYTFDVNLHYSLPGICGTAVMSQSTTTRVIVDRVAPTAQITEPKNSSFGCRTAYVNTVSGHTLDVISISGIAQDNKEIDQYELFYAEGENPANTDWKPALSATRWHSGRREYLPIQGSAPVNGYIDLWNITDLRENVYTLKLKVKDTAGNVSCYMTTFTIGGAVFIDSFTEDKTVFSPNGDGTADDVKFNFVHYAYGTVNLKIVKLLPDNVLDTVTVRTLVAGRQYPAGKGEAIWDGKNDAGTVVTDGAYAAVLTVQDPCGRIEQRWIGIEVDNTPPTLSITYPRAGDAFGTIVEVRGYATDNHFESYMLEAGQGVNPESWTYINRGGSLRDGVLGVWNNYALSGFWTLRLSAGDSVGNKNVVQYILDLTARKSIINDLNAKPALFSPNNDGRLESSFISYAVTQACDIRLEVLDAQGMVKRTHVTQVPSAGSYTYTWDGRNDAGVIVSDGNYTLKLTATSGADAQSESITITVDTTPPAIDIQRPANNFYTPAVDVVISGTINDQNLTGYSINYTGTQGTMPLDQANQTRENYTFGTLNNAPEGNYTLAVKAADQGQNETNRTIAFTIDRTPPVVKLDTPKNNEYYGTVVSAGSGTTVSSQQPAIINITGSIVEKNLEVFNLRYGLGDNPAQWMDLVTGASVTAYPSPVAWKVGKNDGVPDGLYTLSLYVKDKAGLQGEMKVKVTIDNTPPTATITSLHDNDYIKQPVDIKGTVFDQNLDKYTLDISEGQCASAFKWATIKTGAAAVQDNVLGTWQALPPDGDYCVRLTAADKVGSSSEAKVNVKVDTHPPAAPVLSGKTDAKVNAQLDWTRNMESDAAGYNLYRGAQKVNTALLTDIKYLDQNLTEGVYTYTVKAQDFAGWESVASNEIKIKIDLTGPDARIRSPQDGGRVSGLIDVKGTAYSADDFKQYRVYIGQGATPTVWGLIRTSPVPVSYGTLAPWDTFGLGEGQVYSIKLEAEDISGNVTTHQITVTIDNTPPVAPFLISASAIVSNTTVTWRANTESDLAGYFLYRNDQLANVTGGVVGNLKPYLITGTSYSDKALPDGTYQYYLYAMDQAGNMSDQSNTLSVTIDTHPPHATIVDPADASKFGGKIMIKAESPDLDIASVQFQYQSIQSSPTTTADWLNIGSPVTSATILTYFDPVALGLVYGDFRLRAVATDKGNKTDPAPGFITVTYTDLTPPAAPVGLVALTNGGTVTLTWTANTESDLAGYNVYRDGQKMNAAIVTSPEFRDQNLADATYSYTVTALDTHQNESKPSNQAPAKVYTPVITQPYTPLGQNSLQIQGNNAAANSVVSIFNDAGSGLVTLETTTADAAGAFTAGITLSLGENKLTARATDSAGNVSKDAATVVMVYNDTPSAPTGFVAAVQNSAVHLTWNPNPETDILGYNVFRDGVKLNKSDALVVSQATFTASSLFDPYYNVPWMAMDSSLRSYWMPTSGTSVDKPAWWAMNLTVPELISHVEIHWGADLDASGNEMVYAGKDYEIQVWSGYAWITQVKVTGNAVKDNTFDFKPSYRTDKIRIFITDSTDINSAKQVRLAEVNLVKDNVVATQTFDDLNLTNKQYSYAVTAVDNYGFESALSSAATVTVFIAPPSQPAVLTVDAAQTGLNATWVYTGSPATGFNLYRSLVSGGPYTKINSSLVTANQYLDTTVAIGITYYYVVAAVDSIGNEGAYSNEASGTLPLTVLPSRPVIFFPTIAGMPITVFSNTTDIYGSAAPGSLVALVGNGTLTETVSAQPGDTVQNSPLNYDGNGAVLSPDGKLLAYTDNNFIWLKSLATGAITQAVQAPACYTIAWSLDSRKIAYKYGYDRLYGNYRIGIYDVATGMGAPLTSDANINEDYPSWYSDGYKVLFTQEGRTSSSVWTKDLNTGVTTQLLVSTRRVYYPKLSSDGKKLTYFDSQGILYLYDLIDMTSQLIDDNTDGWSHEWSPDGKTLAFVSYRNGPGDLFLLNISDGTQTLVPGSSGDPYYPTWTADGNHVLFDIWDNTSRTDSVWMVDVRTLSRPVQVMPDLASVWYMYGLKTGTIVFVDDISFHLLDLKGTFKFNGISLAPGENLFTATAIGAAGNRSDPSDPVSVTYDPSKLPDLAISSEDVYLYPQYPIAGEQMSVNAMVSNTSQMDAANVDVAVYVWNTLGQLELLKSETIPAILARSSALITATWDSAGKIGDNRLVVVVDPEDKIAESNESNNMAIKDFYVADKVGVSMSTGLDAVQYSSNQNANISVTIRNTGPATSAVLTVQIEDANGYLVSPFDTKTVSLAYATESIQNMTWNTGSTYAGPYAVHTVLKDASGTMLAENTTVFSIVPDAIDDLTVVTDKIMYGPGENVITSFTIKNSGTNSIIPTLQAKASIINALGVVLYTETKTASNLLPGASVDLSSAWNTGLNIPGDYQAIVEVSFDGGATTTKSAAFKINTLLVLTGTITATPSVVPVGNTTQVTYTLTNSGNTDALGYTTRISIIDPETQTVMQTQDAIIDIAKNSSKSGQIPVSTNGYSLKTYTAVLQAVNQGIAKNIANTPFTIKDLTPPTVTIITPAPNSIFNSTVALSVLALDNASGVDKVEYQLDSGLWNLLAAADPAQGRYGTTWNPQPADSGSHTINFRATDKAGNTSAPVSVTFTIQSQDTTPPTGSIGINNGAAYTNNPTATLTLGCTDAESGCSRMQFSSDNVTWSAPEAYGATKAWQLATGDGPKTVYVKFIDGAGNISGAYSAVITLDTTPPILSLSTLADGSYTNNNTLNIAGTATDNIALAGVTINNTEIIVNADGTVSQAVKLASGPNVITTVALDMAENTTTDTRTIILDQTAPVVTITYPHDNSITNKADITITGMVDKPATVSIKVNSGNPAPAIMDGTNFSLPMTLAYGQNTIEVTAIDLAGNVGTAKRTVIFDNISPALAVTNPSQDITTNQPGILLQGTVADLTDITVSISFDGVVSTPTVTNGTFQQQLTFTDEKTYAVIVTAVDAAGNTSTVQRNIIYDKTPPTLTINPVTTPTNIMNQQVSGTMEPGATVAITCLTAVVGVVSYPTTTTWQAIIANMTEGDNLVSATAADQVGNVSAPATAVIVLDTKAPDTLILSGPPALTNINGAGFTFTSTEAGSTFECRLDQGAYAACNSPVNFVNLLDASHTMLVRATDAAGNTDQTPAAYTWIVDTIPPVAVVTGMPVSPTRTTGAALKVSGNDVQAYKYQLDNGAYSPEAAISQPIVITGLAGGTHTVSVAGKDSAGNWQLPEYATTVSWIVDLQPPVLTVSTLPNGAYTNNKTLNISGTATDNVAVKEVDINGAPVLLTADNAFSQVITLATGANTILTIAGDTAGNTSTDVRTIILDQTAPVITITYPHDNSITNQVNITVTGSVDKPATISIKVNNGTVVPATMDNMNFSLPITLVYGQNTIQVTAVDQAGNVGTAKRTVTLDNLNPVLAVTNPAQDISTNQPGILLQGTVADLTNITVTITHDGNTYTSVVTNGTFQEQLTFTTEKTYNVIVTAVDTAGNTSMVQRNIIYDKTPPLLTINPVITPTNSTIQQLSGTMEAGSTVTITCPTAMIGVVSYPTSTTWQAIIADMTEGNNRVSATAIDQVGNVSAPVTAAILLDTHAPITTPSPAPATYNSGVSVSLTTNETSTIYYTINGTTPTTSSPVYTGPIIIATTTTIKFFAIDLVGNREAVKSAVYTINDDVTPPATTMAVSNPQYTAQDGKFYVTSATVFTLFATDNLSGVAKTEYRIDAGAWTLYTPFMVAGEGSHTIGYRSTDNRGNVEAGKTLAVIVDNTPPVSTITIIGTKCQSNNITPATQITLVATDTISGVQSTEYNIDGGAWTAYLGAFTLAGYADGQHTINYRSTDHVGNGETIRSKIVQLSGNKTTLTYTGATLIAQGKAVTLTGTLKADSTTASNPVGKTITFILGAGLSSRSCLGTTDADGNASCTINPVTVPTGPTTVIATFGGDADYQPSTDSKNVIVFAYPAIGAFVIGDKNAVINKTVTFWGSQWWKDNSLSSGSAPASFKGYADNTSAASPGCGGTWSTGPGNSSKPPDSIPSYIAVIAASGITKAGSTISGNSTQIVIVKTNAGYGPDPGHAATGTVVGVLCHN